MRPRAISLAGAAAVALVVGLLALTCAHGSARGATGTAQVASDAGTAAPGGSGLGFSPIQGLPATGVDVIGASPAAGSDEVWAQGQAGSVPGGADPSVVDQQVLLRYSDAASAWQVVPVQVNGVAFSWSASEVTPEGGVVLDGPSTDASGAETLVTGSPQGSFTEAPDPTSVLASGEALSSASAGAGGAGAAGVPLLTAFDDGAGGTGAFVAPYPARSYASSQVDATTTTATGTTTAATSTAASRHAAAASTPTTTAAAPATTMTGTTTTAGTTTTTASGNDAAATGPAVLELDNGTWTREPVCASLSGGSCAAPAGYRPLAVAAASPAAAWLLASVSGQGVELFRRTAQSGGGYAWVALAPATFVLNPAAPAPSGEAAAPLSTGALLTATTQGVWVDAALTGQTTGSVSVLISADPTADVIGKWCYPQAACGTGYANLGAALSAHYTSTAFPGSGPTDPGQRVITGIGGDGSLLILRGAGDFQYTPGVSTGGDAQDLDPGGEAVVGTSGGGAAFTSLTSGWLGEASGISGNQAGDAVVQVTAAAPAADQLSTWPADFQTPMLAVAPQPGSVAGSPSAEALAVGVGGAVTRYHPGAGWQPEYLYDANGQRQTPTLRGVAWPVAGRAYAVGDNGAMWLWQSSTGLWEPDPGAPPGFNGNLNAVAFSPSDPADGYAVGNQGVLLQQGSTTSKSWTQVTLPGSVPAAVQNANFSSVTYAGSEVIIGYWLASPDRSGAISGGLLVNRNDGSGWQVDQGAAALLAQEASAGTVEGDSYRDDAIFKVAGLSGGGAVAAGPGVVIERDGQSGSWHFSPQPLPGMGNAAALSAFLGPAGQTEALVSVDSQQPTFSSQWQAITIPAVPAQANGLSLQLGPDPLNVSGELLRQTDTGWSDLEHADYPTNQLQQQSLQPDAVLALDTTADGSGGWAVGGSTGEGLVEDGATAAIQRQGQTAGLMSLGSPLQSALATASAPAGGGSAAITAPAGQVSFAVGGDASCVPPAVDAEPCSDLADIGVGADVWTVSALHSASAISGLSAFLWTGDRLGQAGGLTGDQLSREMARYGALLHSGSLPTYAAISPAEAGVGAAGFKAALGTAAPVGQSLAGTPAPPAGTAAYAFAASAGSGGTVDVIVLDDSAGTLDPGGQESAGGCPASDSAATQLDWLCTELHAARAAGQPAVVLGSANLSDPSATNYAADAAAVTRVLVSAGASAYLFDALGQNVTEQLSSGGMSIPAYGSGSLGYVTPPDYSVDNLGAAGYLMVSVNAAARNATTNVAPVSAQLIPNVGSLAVDANSGTLLHRSQVALFSGLARLPPAGRQVEVTPSGTIQSVSPQAYVPIPETCQGADCGRFISPQYTFTSSNPDVGDFVEPSPTNATQVYEPDGKPVQDAHSGLFCAYNAGTTTVTLSAGGLTTSLPVTVQAGSALEPCGTVPLTNPPQPAALTVPNLTVTPPPAVHGKLPGGNPLKVPAAPHPVQASKPVRVPTPPGAPAPAARPLPAKPLPAKPPTPVRVFPAHPIVPPAAPSVVQPTPPSGTAQVQSPITQGVVEPIQVGVDQEEKQADTAVQSVHQMVVYAPDRGSVIPPWSLALAPLAALALALAVRAGRSQKPVRADCRAHSGPRHR